MMHETEYAYAVARVRANELTLLSATDVEQLISAEDYKQVMRRLADTGWGDSENVTDYSHYLEQYKAKTWELLVEIMEDIHELDMLIIRNDMQNLKAALKSAVSHNDPENLYISPTVYDTEAMIKAVEQRMFETLPECMSDVAVKAYDILTRTGNGQLADIILDTRTLDLIYSFGKKSRNELLSILAEYICATTNIKTAFRCAHTGKNREFIEDSICECDTLNKQDLIVATLEGPDALMDFLSKTNYSEAVEMFHISTSAFEKWCDDLIMNCIKPARYKAFGVDPIVAYYLAKDAEIKSVRIIL
ncbi:MAG: V-type ATPase subunit, partial [Oscillospiraceae bacterium]